MNLNHDSMPSPEDSIWEDLIDRAIEGTIAIEDGELLERGVVEHESIRESYLRAAHLHACLRVDAGLHAQSLNSETGPSTGGRPTRILLAAAAGVALVAGAWLLGYQQGGDESPAAIAQTEPDTVARVKETIACKWGGSLLPTLEGSILEPGMLDLMEGMATLEFDSGATVVLEAPAQVEIVSPMALRLVRGSIVAEVPESAIGFTVETEEGKVIDYGTRFGLTYGGNGRAHVIVFDGEVGVVDRENPAERRVKGGGNTFFGPEQQYQPDASEGEPDRGVLNFEAWEREGWRVISTREGRGRDTSIRFQDQKSAARADAPLLSCKHSSFRQTNERHVYLGVDLSSLPGDHVIDTAELVLQIEPTHLGHAAVVPDCTFKVWGLLDQSLDEWDEDRIHFGNAPAVTQGTVQLDQSALVPLGEFVIEQGVASGSRKIASKELVDFLNSDTNGLVSLIVQRVTDELEDGGIVHAFASREHPTAAAPVLKLRTETP